MDNICFLKKNQYICNNVYKSKRVCNSGSLFLELSSINAKNLNISLHSYSLYNFRNVLQRRFLDMSKMFKDVTYKEFAEKLKNGHVYTSDRALTSDNVLSAALINKVADNEGIERPEIHRIPRFQLTDEMKENNIVFDIGGGMFDSHKENLSMRDNGIPYSGFGEMFAVVGEELFKDRVSAMDKGFVEKIDIDTDSVHESEYSKMIHNMNPSWNENFKTSEAYFNAVRIAEQSLTERDEMLFMGESKDLSGLVNEVEKDISENRSMVRENAMAEARNIIKEQISKAETIESNEHSYGIIHFDRPGIPYKLVQEMTKETDIVGYTFPSRDAVSYKPLAKDDCADFALAVPDKWRGSSEFEVDGMTYCHPAGITMSFNSMEDCMNAVQYMADEQNAAERDIEVVDEQFYSEQQEDLAI